MKDIMFRQTIQSNYVYIIDHKLLSNIMHSMTASQMSVPPIGYRLHKQVKFLYNKYHLYHKIRGIFHVVSDIKIKKW